MRDSGGFSSGRRCRCRAARWPTGTPADGAAGDHRGFGAHPGRCRRAFVDRTRLVARGGVAGQANSLLGMARNATKRWTMQSLEAAPPRRPSNSSFAHSPKSAPATRSCSAGTASTHQQATKTRIELPTSIPLRLSNALRPRLFAASAITASETILHQTSCATRYSGQSPARYAPRYNTAPAVDSPMRTSLSRLSHCS